MILKVKNSILQQEVILNTSSNTPDDEVNVDYSGEFSESLKRDLADNGYGYYGHVINLENITNLDLHATILALPGWVIIEAKGIPTPTLKEDILQE